MTATKHLFSMFYRCIAKGNTSLIIIMIFLFAPIENYFASTTIYILTKTIIIYNNISLKKLNQSFYKHLYKTLHHNLLHHRV